MGYFTVTCLFSTNTRIFLIFGWTGFLCFCWNTVAVTADLKIQSHPQDVNAAFGENTFLNCTFNEPVNCMWHRNDNPIEVSGRYIYTHKDGKDTYDCSIKIENLRDLDIGTWQCENKVDKGETPKKSRIARIVKRIPTTQSATTDAHISENIEDSGPADPSIIVEFSNREYAILECLASDNTAADYRWDYRPLGSEKWTQAMHNNSISTGSKDGYFICSAVINGKRFYSTQYRIITSESDKSHVKFISMGVVIGFLVGLLSAILVFSFKPNAFKSVAGCFKRNPGHEPTGEKIPLVPSGSSKTIQPPPESLIIQCESDAQLSNSEEIKIIAQMKQNGVDQQSLAPGVFLWRIDDYFINKQNGVQTFLQSEPFDVGEGYKMRLNVHFNGFGKQRETYMSLGLLFDNNKDPEKKIYSHRRIFMLLDQSGKGKNITRYYEPRFRGNFETPWMQKPFGPRRFANHSIIEDEERGYIKDDAIIIKIIVESIDQILDRHIQYLQPKQSVLWKIENFWDKKRDEKAGIIPCVSSETFYTFSQGYRMKAVLYLNGNGEGKGGYVSIYFAFFKSKHDELLPNPYPHKVQFKLIDQQSMKNKPPKSIRHVTRTEILNPKDIGKIEGQTRMQEFRGFAKFVKQSDVKNNGRYLNRDDVMYIEITVTNLDDNDKEKSTKVTETIDPMSDVFAIEME